MFRAMVHCANVTNRVITLRCRVESAWGRCPWREEIMEPCQHPGQSEERGPKPRMSATLDGTAFTRNGPIGGSVNSPSGGESQLSREWLIIELRLLVAKWERLGRRPHPVVPLKRVLILAHQSTLIALNQSGAAVLARAWTRNSENYCLPVLRYGPNSGHSD